MDYIIPRVENFSSIPGNLSSDVSITIIISDLKISNFSEFCVGLRKYANNVDFLFLDFDDVFTEGGLIRMFCTCLASCVRLQQLSLRYIDANIKGNDLQTLWQTIVNCKKLTSLGISIHSSQQVNEESFTALVEYLPRYPSLEIIYFANIISILTIEQKLKLEVALKRCRFLKQINDMEGEKTVDSFITECLTLPVAVGRGCSSSSPRNYV